MIPASVPADLVLVRTGHVAIAVGSIRAYPNGFEFTLRTRLRREDEAGPAGADPFEYHWHRRGTRVPDDVLRVGVMYADGRRAAATGGRPWPGEGVDAGRLVLLVNAGGGSERIWDGDFWVCPVPPEGPVTFVASWLRHGVAETRADIDGAAIREAARRAVVLWPEEPDFEPGGGLAGPR